MLNMLSPEYAMAAEEDHRIAQLLVLSTISWTYPTIGAARLPNPWQRLRHWGVLVLRHRQTSSFSSLQPEQLLLDDQLYIHCHMMAFAW